jgi:polyhydroxybutyrate depolymerase
VKYGAVVAAVLAVLLLACGGGNSRSESSATRAPQSTATTAIATTPASNACNPTRAHASGESDQTVASGGLERTYILHVPPGYDGTTPMPLVLLFHGYAENARIMLDYSEMGKTADEHSFILVAPNGAGGPPHWNAMPLLNGANDVQFVRDLLAKLDKELCTDPARTFATGFSNGSAMSLRLSCDLPERIRATGHVAEVDAHCIPKAPAIIFQGAVDPLVPMIGGGAYFAGEGTGVTPPVRSTVKSWAEAQGCDAANPTVTKPSAHIELTMFNACQAGNGAVQLYVVDGGGHAWPGGSDAFGDPAMNTHEINASELIWQFFSGIR